MKSKEKIFSTKSAAERSARMVKTIFGCMWSPAVY